jgi:hypothetical protein
MHINVALTFTACIFALSDAYSFTRIQQKVPRKSSSRTELNATFSRRTCISSIVCTSLISVPFSKPLDSFAQEEAPEESTAKSVRKFSDGYISEFLKEVPTFTLVDDKGVPFSVVGEDAKLSSYFFTTYTEADRILKTARVSADKAIKELKKEENDKRRAKGEKPMSAVEEDDVIGINPWKEARISTVPLDFGVSLANRGKIKGGYFRIAAQEKDIADAMEIEKIDDLAEGKVPLFYYEDFEIDMNGKSRIPLYFGKDQLQKEWKTRHTKDEYPPIKVTELFSLLGEMVKATDETSDVEELSKLFLVPPTESIQKAKLCEKKGGSEPPFKLGERIIVL